MSVLSIIVHHVTMLLYSIETDWKVKYLLRGYEDVIMKVLYNLPQLLIHYDLFQRQEQCPDLVSFIIELKSILVCIYITSRACAIIFL